MSNNENEDNGQQQGAGEEPGSEQLGTDTACQRRTGPRTPAGKARSKRNAVKHGLFSRAMVLLPHESQSEFDDLVKGLRRSLRPKGTLEDLFVDEIATDAWCRGRVLAKLAYIDPLNADMLLRCEIALGRAQERALNQLKQAQDMRERQSGVNQRSVGRSPDESKGEVRLTLAPSKA